ncbi:MAG TPA: FesM [Candidatus Limnocylindria bacterium]
MSPTPSTRPAADIDVLAWPVVGPFLRWRHARTSLQLVLLLVAAVAVLHGLTGPDLAPQNLASVLTWVHYRGLLILALLVAGNVFCMGCPFVLVRDAARRLHRPRRSWPRLLRSKWAGLALLVAVLFAYELFDLWALPQGTAWLILAYFGAALAVDLVFTGAGFCKYLCPIGQFNFTASAVSPLEIGIRDASTCAACRTADCVRGRRHPERPDVTLQRGCELHLFLPAKVGNTDCTFCLDCVQACPHDNVALAVRTPAGELADDRVRSSLGRLSARGDLAALAVVFTFGALLNAFAMTSPVHAVERWLAAALDLQSELPVLALVFAAVLLAAPFVLLGGASFSTRLLVPPADRRPAGVTFRSFAHALVPLGFSLWLAHYGFHLATGALTVIPVSQSAAIDLLGWAALGEPRWTLVGMRPGSVFPLQLGAVLLGTIGSISLAWLIAEREHPRSALRAALPWALVVVLLAAVSVWVFLQPMEMRGTSLAG